MTMEQLQSFIAVARHLSYSRASEYLYLSNSTVSRHISNLEDMLGAKLFFRDTREVRLTEAGALFYNEVAPALRQIEGAEIKVSRLSQHADSDFVLCTYPLFNELLATLYKQYRIGNPKIDFSIYKRTGGEIADWVYRGKADVGVSFSFEVYDQQRDFEIITITADRFCVVVSESHALAEGSSVHITKLQRFTNLYFLNYPAYRFLKSCALPAGGFMVPEIPPRQSATIDSLLVSVEAGMGIGFMPRSVALEIANNCKMLDIDGIDSSFDIVMFWRRGQSAAGLRSFLELYYEYFCRPAPL